MSALYSFSSMQLMSTSGMFLVAGAFLNKKNKMKVSLSIFIEKDLKKRTPENVQHKFWKRLELEP